MITQLCDGQYQAISRGSIMLLTKRFCSVNNFVWEMKTDNASHRAHRSSLGIRTFHNLKEVEKAYKTWNGVTKLVDEECPIFSNGSHITITRLNKTLTTNCIMSDDTKSLLHHACDSFGFILPMGQYTLNEFADKLVRYSSNERVIALSNTLRTVESLQP
ncbi:hypothetical protein A1QO_03990 [Vibrio genomosp. F10 str. ZF-129]|uniref:Uncharacterized protein n=1 Tax=Vibrio genomosp. F10 str. ZF-129 TaxID=1187848 RepID=A0A1E5BIY6_9VIBR|nr:hypothetical protein [Vibrio genomosp. F10]OEE37272.1 hypothetical protein A1QO_03990 [Vibrio genomosp. F10 str. ZF-129]